MLKCIGPILAVREIAPARHFYEALLGQTVWYNSATSQLSTLLHSPKMAATSFPSKPVSDGQKGLRQATA
jgi:hypothetical protein